MEYRMYSHRYAEAILNTDREFAESWKEVQEVIHSITDEQIINVFEAKGPKRGKSISATINELLKDAFTIKGWRSESPIFQNPDYKGDTWRLDFAKENIGCASCKFQRVGPSNKEEAVAEALA